MTEKQLTYCVLFLFGFSALCFLCGYCFGKADGTRETSKDWQKHLNNYVEPLIKVLNEQIAFYKENSFLRDKAN